MNNKAQFIQQAKQIAQEEAKRSFSSVTEQITGESTAQTAIEAAQPVDEHEGANIEEIRRQEAAKMDQLRKRLEEEMQRARQMRQQTYQEYSQKVDQQFQADKPKESEQAPFEMPHSVPKGPQGPAGVQSKKGTKEMGKMKG